LFAALYLAQRLKAAGPKDALVRASSSVDCVLRASVAARADEMRLVELQGDLADPAQLLEAIAV
jgi:pyridoxal/pyridoxine/pyridoxamine kinase